MLEYTDKYWKMITPSVKKSLSKRYGKEYANNLILETHIIYKDLLKKAPDIGKENSMSANMYECIIFFALYDAAKGKISKEEMKDIVNEILSMPILKVVGIFLNLNKESHLKKFADKMKKNQKWLEEHPEYKEYSWDFHFDESKNKEGFYYHFTKCPINTFARQEGYLDILPILCDVDFKTASLMHAKLYREFTLASGGKLCDYWFVGDKIQDPK